MLRRSPKHLKDTPTDAEIRLWAALRDRRLAGYKFRRPRRRQARNPRSA